MKNIFKVAALCMFLLACLNNLHAAKRYWIASSADYWNNGANWSATSGGTGGAGVPGSSDTAYFDGNSVFNDTIDVAVSIRRLDISSGFTGKIVQRSFTITIGVGGATLSGGIFSGGSAAITVSGPFVISGTAFTSTSATMTLGGDYTLSSGSFTHNSGKVTFVTANTIAGSSTFNQLSFAPVSVGSTFTLAPGTNLTVNGNFYYDGSQGIRIDGDTIKVKGDIYLNNSTAYGNPGNATLFICGTSVNQTLNGAASTFLSNPINICIQKSATDTLFLLNTITTNRDWKLVSGVQVPGSSTVLFFFGGSTITGNQAFNNLTFDSQSSHAVYTIATGNTVTVNGTLSYTGSQGISINTGTISAKGNISLGSTSATGGGSGLLLISGTGSQSVTGAATLGNSPLCKVEINKPSGTVSFSNYITVRNDWTYTAGTISTGSSTVYFWGNLTITGTHSLFNVRFWGGNVSYIVATGSILTVTGTLTTDGSGICNLYSGTIYAQGDIDALNDYTANFGLANLVINGTGNQTFTSNSSFATAGRLPHIEIDKPSGTLTLVGVLSLYGDWTYTAGTVNPGSSTVYFGNNVYGTQTLNNAVIRDGMNLSMGTGITITLNGSLTYANGGSGIGNGFYYGTFDVKGDVTVNNTTAASVFAGIGTIKFSGTSGQTLTGSGVSGGGKIPNIIIDKSSGTLTLASVISVTGDWTYVQGAVSPGSSTTLFYGTANLDAQGSGSIMSFNAVGIAGTITLTGNIDINSNLTIGNSTTLSAGSNSVYVGGQWNNTGGTWTYGTSTVIFDGSTYKQIKRTSGGLAATETFYNLTFHRRGASMTFANPVTVNNVLTMTRGHIKTTTTNYLLLIDGATLVGGSDSAYVHGPVRKTGDDAFTFPLGDTTLADTAYHPLAMTAPSSNTDQFEATYFALNYPVGDSLVDSLLNVNQLEYWSFERKNGSSSPGVQLGWNRNSDIYGFEDLVIAQWDGFKWIARGQSAITATLPQGNITSLLTLNFSGLPVLYLVTAHAKKVTRYAIVEQKLDGGYFMTGRILRFKFDEEYNTAGNNLMYRIISIGTNENVTSQLAPSSANMPVINYGDNRFGIDLIDLTGAPLASGFYILEVNNEKNEKWYLRFKL